MDGQKGNDYRIIAFLITIKRKEQSFQIALYTIRLNNDKHDPAHM